jgi:hypothetical protein
MTTSNDLEKMSLIYNVRVDDILYLDDFINSPKIGNFIINLDLSKTGGTHWVSIINLKNKLYYFDPFGTINQEIKNKLEKSTKKPVIYNNLKIQNIQETSCGPLSIAFLKEAEKIKTDKEFNDAIKEVTKYKIIMPDDKNKKITHL